LSATTFDFGVISSSSDERIPAASSGSTAA